MQQPLGKRQLEPSIMKQLFAQRLPTNAQLILASSKDDFDMEGLARLADKILEISSAQTSSPILATVSQQPTPSTENRVLRDTVQQLITTVSNLTFSGSNQRGRSHPRTRSQASSNRYRTPSPRRQTGNTNTTNPLCWHYNKFGPSA